MIGVFGAANATLGPVPGYLIGFLVYWGVWCLVVPLLLLGSARAREPWRDRRPHLGHLGSSGSWPCCFHQSGHWLPDGSGGWRREPDHERGGAHHWRGERHDGGAAVARCVSESVAGRLAAGSRVWPTIGFAAWHFALQVIHAAAMGAASYVLASGVLCLCCGWAAWRTRLASLVVAVAPHHGQQRNEERCSFIGPAQPCGAEARHICEDGQRLGRHGSNAVLARTVGGQEVSQRSYLPQGFNPFPSTRVERHPSGGRLGFQAHQATDLNRLRDAKLPSDDYQRVSNGALGDVKVMRRAPYAAGGEISSQDFRLASRQSFREWG